MVGSVDQVGAGVVRSALGNDLDGGEDILESLDNGGDEHVNSGGGAHGHNDVQKDFPHGNLIQPCGLNNFLGYAGDTG